MIPFNFISNYLGFLLLFYFLVHLPLDIYMILRKSKAVKTYGIKQSGTLITLLGFISVLMWVFWLFSIFLNWEEVFPFLVFVLPSNLAILIQTIGLSLVLIGVLVAVWSRIIRGLHSHAWGLTEDTPLFSNGPFRWIRHPSYFFYCTMFIGLPLITRFWPSLVLLLGIYSYMLIIEVEEELLNEHFGNKYTEYQKTTYKLIPFLW